MKYSVVQCVNGNFSIVSEHDNEQSAIMSYHDRCKILCNASDVITGCVKVVNENFDQLGNKVEFITHEPQPAPAEEVPTEE